MELCAKSLARGRGDKSVHGGGSKIIGWGGTALDGGYYPLKGAPPILESPAGSHTDFGFKGVMGLARDSQ